MAEKDSQAGPPPADQSPRMQPEGEHLIDLHSGKGLRFGEAEKICRGHFTTIILFAGAAKCGKTTLLSSLLLLFQRAPFARFLFAGSRTLVGFEERNYHVEIVSGLPTPTQERTVLTEVLHLCVRADDLTQASHLLLCDLSGEEFREAKDSLDACKSLGIIRRADCFVLLVDGAKLSDFENRHRAKNDAITLLRSCLDAKMLDSESVVDVLITKWDLIQNHQLQADIEAFAAHVEESLIRQFLTRVKQIHTYRVAAHPHSPEMPLGYGLDVVFRSWLERRSRKQKQPTVKLGPADVATEYDRFLWRGAGLANERKR